MKPMRECECGTIALTEEDLELFEKDSNSKFGRRNRCKVCSAEKVKGEQPLKGKCVTCTQCKVSYAEPLESYKMFRRVAPTGDLVIGALSRICKVCEAKNLLETGTEFVEIDGRLIPKDLNSINKGIRISSKPLAALETSRGILDLVALQGITNVDR